MSQIPPYQMGSPDGGPPSVKKKSNVWMWVLLAMIGVCGICGVIGAAVLVPVFAQARIAGKSARELSLAKQVATSAFLYMTDFDDKMPPFKSSQEISVKLDKYLKRTSERTVPLTYTWNTSLSGITLGSVESSDQVWMFHSVKLDLNRYAVGYFDAHCKRIDEKELQETKVKSVKILNAAKLKNKKWD